MKFCKAEVDVALRMEKSFVLLSDNIGDSIKVITVPNSFFQTCGLSLKNFPSP
jgi:hypothetical protein